MSKPAKPRKKNSKMDNSFIQSIDNNEAKGKFL